MGLPDIALLVPFFPKARRTHQRAVPWHGSMQEQV
jgi:hypothetical protein